MSTVKNKIFDYRFLLTYLPLDSKFFILIITNGEIMKKKIILSLLLILFSFSTISAVPIHDFLKGENWIPYKVVAGAGNDRWGFGISLNYDDQKSFSFNTEIVAQSWFFKGDLEAITNRGWKEKWSFTDPNITDADPANFLNGRYDVLNLQFGLKLDLLTRDFFTIRFYPSAGVSLVGNLKLDVIQNNNHRKRGIQLVNLPYDFNGVQTKALVNGTVVFDFPVVDIKSRSTLHFNVAASSGNIFGFETNFLAKAGLSITEDNVDFFSMDFGFKWVNSHIDWPTESIYATYQRGPYLNIKINTGTYALNFESYLRQKCGFTTITLDVLSLFSKSLWQNDDIMLSVGKMYFFKSDYTVTKIEYPITEGFSFIMLNNFLSGYPIDSENDISYDFSTTPRYRKSYVNLLVGGRYQFDFEPLHGWVTPYIQLASGFMKWELFELRNMIPTSDVPWKTLGSEYSFIIDTEIGFDIIPAGVLKSKYNSIRLNLFTGFVYTSNEDKIKTMIKNVNAEEAQNISSFSPKFGFSIKFGLDL